MIDAYLFGKPLRTDLPTDLHRIAIGNGIDEDQNVLWPVFLDWVLGQNIDADTLNGYTFEELQDLWQAYADTKDVKINSNTGRIINLENSQPVGYEVYSNYEDRSDGRSFLPPVGVEKVSYKVADDAVDSDLNGYYRYENGAYQPDASLVNGIVEEGNVDAVNGGAVWEYTKKIIGILQETDKSLPQGEGYIDASGNVVSNSSFAYKILKVIPNQRFYLYAYTESSASTAAVAIKTDGTTEILADGDFDKGVEIIVPANCYELRVSSVNIDGHILALYNENISKEYISELKDIIEEVNVLNSFMRNGDYFEDFIAEAVDSGDGTFTASVSWARTPFIKVKEGDAFVYTGNVLIGNPIIGYGENFEFVTSSIIVGSGVKTDVQFEVPAGVAYLVAYSRNLGDTFYMNSLGDVSVRSINMIGYKKELRQIAASANQPYSGSVLGYEIIKPLGANTAVRHYLIPNGLPSGIKTKFEMFATDYEADAVNYSAMNLLVWGDRVEIGNNRNGTEGRLKLIIGGDYVGSALQSASSRIEFLTDDKVLMKGRKYTFEEKVGFSVSEYTDNAAALADGLVIGEIYRTGDLMKIVH